MQNPRPIDQVIHSERRTGSVLDAKSEALLSTVLQKRMSKEFGQAVTDFGVSYRERAEVGHAMEDSKELLLGKKANKNYDMSAIEAWLGDRLQDAEYFKVPGTLKRAMQSTAKNRDPRDGKVDLTIDYGIDRFTLN